MKRLTFLLLVCLASLNGWGQDITGYWSGTLKVQSTQLQLVFHIQKSELGYVATMDSPDQGAKDIPVTSVSYENSVLKLSLAALVADYEGTLGDDGSITGTFKQMGQAFPLKLSRQAVEKEKAERPQEPVKPYPYYEEEVTFENREDSVTLAGTLTLPQREGVFPAVVLISGSGAQNRDEELMEHKPFLVIADYLTRNGIAVLRFDDRGTAASTGSFAMATTYDFSKDAEAGVKYLQTRKEVNRAKIGLIGHSEGGVIAPMVAARSSDIAFIVLLAGSGLRGDQILLMQQELIAEASGVGNVGKEAQKLSRSINEGAFNIVLKSTDTEQLKTALTDYLRQAIDSLFAAKDIPDTEKWKEIMEIYDDNFITAAVSQMVSPWTQYFIRYDPAPALEKVRCPVLALNGEKDLQVPAKANLEAIKAALAKGGNRQVTAKELPGLNHLFQECKTGLPTEYAAIAQTFSPVALNEMLTWIKAQTQ
ncbi:MAG: alpha/beta fold hydrolase [Prevotellaceae bacterium]|jgi:pimeloyl-ACP methyl ester carboxylesterase|nr:alpha/beta fold hydrolase [Prevotellaceae bacterium]